MPVLELDRASKSFGGVHALRSCTLGLDRGRVLRLQGHNGSGKTTAVNLLCGFVAPDGGDVRWKGRSVRDVPFHRRRALGISRSFQHPRLFGEWDLVTCVEFAVSCTGSGGNGARRAAEESLAALGIQASGRPASMEPEPTRKLTDLAIALAGRPAALLLDEPCAGLDEHCQAVVVAGFLVAALAEWAPAILLIDHADLLTEHLARVAPVDHVLLAEGEVQGHAPAAEGLGRG